jgi:putative transposase
MRDRLVLRENQLVSHGGENWRILQIQDLQRVLAARISDERLEFLPISELQLPTQSAKTDEESISTGSNNKDAALIENQSVRTDCKQAIRNRRVRKLPAQDDLTKKQIKAREQAVLEFQEALKVLGAPRRNRRALVATMCKRFGYNEATAYRRLKIVDVHGNADALMHAVRLDFATSRLEEGVIKAIRSHLKDYRFVQEPKTIPDILELINGQCRQGGWKEISESTLRKFERETTLKQKLEAQGQKKKAADAFRVKAGHLPNNDYPLAIVQVDHTPLQICLVDEVDRQPIGDPWLTLVIDTYSRMVLGFYLSFDAPSTLNTGLALAHAFLPKDDYLHQVHVRGEWPCWGFPDIILVDNAVELNGQMMHGARRRYRFILRDRPVGAPNFGGHVESAFRTFMNEFKSVPGTKFSNPVERGEYDSEGRAIFTIAEFESFFTEFLVNDYHLRGHSGEGMDGTAPLLKWNKGIFEGDEMPPTGLPDRPVDPLELRISLMPILRRTVRNGTIQALGEDYHSGALTLLSDAIDLTKPLSQRKFEVRYDPRNISKVWLYNDTNTNYIEVPFADLRKGPISLWEHDAIKKRRGDPSAQFKDQRYESKMLREDMKVKAAKKTRGQRLEDEKALRRAAGALVQPPPAAKNTQKTSSKKQSLNPARLKALRDKVRPADLIKPSAKGTNDDT